MPIRFAFLAAVCSAALSAAGAQTSTAKQSAATPVAATAPTVVPALVLYSGTAVSDEGKPLAGDRIVTFLLFRDESGGQPLWAETQRVPVDIAGRYSTQLGGSSPSGIPLTVFASGEARWLEVQIAGQQPQTRVLLTSVPYAAKAADAATLGGLPPSAFVLVSSQLAATLAASAISSETASTVTTAGGASKYLPVFSGASTIGNSEIYDTGTSVGIGDIPNAAARLDVNGGIIMRGGMTVSRTGNATSSQAFPSYPFAFYSNVYDTSTKTADNPHFLLQSEPTGNNTASTGATFNLLYSNRGSAPAETGLSFNPTGILKFASGQTFPGTGTGNGTITGVTAGSGLIGGGTSGAVTLANAGILALTAGYGFQTTGGQSPTLTVDTTVIPTLSDKPSFSGGAEFYTSDFRNEAVRASGSSGAIGLYGSSDTAFAVYGIGTANGATGVFGTSHGGSLLGSEFRQSGIYSGVGGSRRQLRQRRSGGVACFGR